MLDLPLDAPVQLSGTDKVNRALCLLTPEKVSILTSQETETAEQYRGMMIAVWRISGGGALALAG